MDAIDLKIIELLKQNSRTTGSDISKKIHLSVPAVAERIRKLEEGKIINSYTLQLNREKFNLNLLAFILVIIDKSENINLFKEGIKAYNEVLECHHIAGEYDYMLKVAVENTAKLEDFISSKLKKALGVSRTNTIIALSTYKEEI